MRINQKDLKTISRCSLFKDCSEEEIKTMLSCQGVSLLRSKAGDYILRSGSCQHLFGILIKGSASVERKSEDGLMHMSRLTSADMFGAASVFSDENGYVVDIRSLSDIRMICISEEQLIEWFQMSKTVLKNYLRYLNSRIRFLNKRLDALSKNSVSSKLMSHFISESKDGIYELRSYTELSEMLCLSRATMYRALDQLCEDQKIRRDGKRIILLEEQDT